MLISEGHKREEIYKSAGCLQTRELSWKNSLEFMKDTLLNSLSTSTQDMVLLG